LEHITGDLPNLGYFGVSNELARRVQKEPSPEKIYPGMKIDRSFVLKFLANQRVTFIFE